MKEGKDFRKEILQELRDLREEMKAYRERFRNDLETIVEETVVDGILDPLFTTRLKQIDENMNTTLPRDCKQRDKCVEKFHNFFEKLLEENKGRDMEAGIDRFLDEKASELEKLEKSMPYERCEYCFETAFDLLEKETDLLKSLHSSETFAFGESEPKGNLSSKVVEEVLSPLDNRARIKIINALAEDSKSFSELSKITSLAGGNLTFHLNKLQEKNFVIQKHRGGEYWITEKGMKTVSTLRALAKQGEED